MKKYFGVLAILVVETISNVQADEPMKPLGVKVHVTAACEVSIVRGIPENSAELMRQALATSGPVRERCHKRAVWKIDVDGTTDVVEIDKDGGTRDVRYLVSSDSEQTVNRARAKSNAVKVTVNF